jgi:hypothetical protein
VVVVTMILTCSALVLSSLELGCAATADMPSTRLNTSGAIHRQVAQSMHLSSAHAHRQQRHQGHVHEVGSWSSPTKNSPETFCRRGRFRLLSAGGEDAVARTTEAARRLRGEPGGGTARDAAARRLSAMAVERERAAKTLVSLALWSVTWADLSCSIMFAQYLGMCI